MKKELANTGLGTGALVGALGSFIQTALERIGLLETSLWLKGLLDLTPGFNWPGVWFIVFIFCCIALVVFNFQYVLLAGVWLLRKPLFMSGGSAVTYIAYWSVIGESWPGPAKTPQALLALKKAAAEKKVTLMGRGTGSLEMTPIPVADLARGDLIVTAIPPAGQTLSLVAAGGGMVLFSGIIANQEQVRKVWKNARPTDRFLGWNEGAD